MYGSNRSSWEGIAQAIGRMERVEKGIPLSEHYREPLQP